MGHLKLQINDDPLFLGVDKIGFEIALDITAGQEREPFPWSEHFDLMSMYLRHKADLVAEVTINPTAFGDQNTSADQLAIHIQQRLTVEWIYFFTQVPFLYEVKHYLAVKREERQGGSK